MKLSPQAPPEVVGPSGPGRARAHEPTDEQLMRRVQDGDQRAFAALYDRHAGRAYRVARRACNDAGRAEDAVQEGFLSIWRGRAGYRPQAGSFQAWAVAAVRNRAVDIVRLDAAARRPETVELRDGDDDRVARSVHDELIGRNDSESMLAEVERLPGPQAEVIALAYFGDLTQAEIAARLAMPRGTVKGRIRLGLEKLRRQMRVQT